MSPNQLIAVLFTIKLTTNMQLILIDYFMIVFIIVKSKSISRTTQIDYWHMICRSAKLITYNIAIAYCVNIIAVDAVYVSADPRRL